MNQRNGMAVTILTVMAIVHVAYGATYSGGAGTKADPYQIGAVADWNTLAATSADWDKQFLLTEDIDFGGASLTPIGSSLTNFTGVFDGGGHIVRNGEINRPGSDYVGLFGYVGESGIIENLGAENGAVSGTDYVGGLVGMNWGTVMSCYATGATTGSTYVGGLVGFNRFTVRSCYATGAVSGTECVGGLAGYNGGTVRSCYVTGAVSGTYRVGGLVGGGRAEMSFWDMETTGQAGSSGGRGLTTSQMKTLLYYRNSDWNTYDWVMIEGDYPRLPWEGLGWPVVPIAEALPFLGAGTVADPYHITTAAEFALLSWHTSILDKCLCLKVDLDLYGTSIYPIGGLGPFIGVFDGSGHIVRNGEINLQGSDFVGLFGYVGSSGIIKNLGTENVAVSGTSYVGGLVGWNDGTVTSCYATGAVSGTGVVGGLVGYTEYGTIISCYASGAVSGNNYVGGLVGANTYGTMTSCYATGAVSSSGEVGGLVCHNEDGTITSCFWDTETSGQVMSAGGLGLSTIPMMQQSSYAGWDFSAVWGIDEGKSYPYLLVFGQEEGEGEGEPTEGEGEPFTGNFLTGIVVDDTSGSLLSGVSVTVHRHRILDIIEAWTTTADGEFLFEMEDADNQYDLRFTKTGYEPLYLGGLLVPQTLTARMIALAGSDTDVPAPRNLSVLVSAGQVILRWDAPISADIAGYYVYRDGVKLTATPVTGTSYIDQAVTPGATYTYQVSTVNGAGKESALSSPVTVTITLGLWIPQVSGAPGTEVYTTLNITNARDIEATTSAGFTIQLEYDPDVIAGITAEAGVILRELNTAITDEGNGLLTLSALNPGAPLQLTGEGKLFDLHITLLAGAELGCSELKTPLLDFFDTNGNRIPAALIGDTQICAGDAQLLGDLDADELLTAGDAVLSMLISSRQITPTEYQHMVGDVNGDGRLDAADTVLIHRLASNWRMNPLEDETTLADLLAGLVATVSLPEVEARPGTQVTLGLDVGPLAGLAGADFVIAQDDLLLAGSGAAQFPGLPESFSRTVNQQPHGFRATISSPEALGENSLEAPMLTVTFTVSPEATPGMLLPVTIANAGLKGQYGEDYDWYTTVSLVSGAVRVIGDAEGEGEGEGEPEEGEPVEGEPAEGEGEPLTPDEIKQTLLNQFAAADTNGDGQLSFEEAFAVLNGLTQEQFDALDTDDDGKLSIEELGGEADDRCGCCKSTGTSKDLFKRYLGDWLLVGLSMLILLAFISRHKQM